MAAAAASRRVAPPKDDKKLLRRYPRERHQDRPAVSDADQHRLSLFDEIVGSEAKFVDDLRTLCDRFAPLVDSKRLLAKDDAATVFGNAGELLKIHETLLSKLRDADRKTRGALKTERPAAEVLRDAETWFAEAFRAIAPFVRAAHSRYSENYPNALRVLQQSSPTTKQPLPSSRKELANLDAYLVRPLQRITKYPLFFKSLAELSPRGHISRDLRETLAIVEEVADAVNSAVDNGKIVEIYARRFEAVEALGSLVVPSRRFVCEGAVRATLAPVARTSPRSASLPRGWAVRSTSTGASNGHNNSRRAAIGTPTTTTTTPEEATFFLFSDCLLLARPPTAASEGKCRLRHRVDLNDLSVRDAIDPQRGATLFLRFTASSDSRSYSFEATPALQDAKGAVDVVLDVVSPAELDDASERCDAVRSALVRAIADTKAIRSGLEARRSRQL